MKEWGGDVSLLGVFGLVYVLATSVRYQVQWIDKRSCLSGDPMIISGLDLAGLHNLEKRPCTFLIATINTKKEKVPLSFHAFLFATSVEYIFLYDAWFG